MTDPASGQAASAVPRPRRGAKLPADDLLDLMRWHIDRYDRLRSSTSSRAAAILSANAIIIAGSVLLANYHFQSNGTPRRILVEVAFAGLAFVTLILVLRSLWSCIDAIAARKTVRMVNSEEIDSRFLFNWGDTLGEIDGHSSFTVRVLKLTMEDVLKNAASELWTDILQHSRRHRHLRNAVTVFKYGVISFLGLTVLTFALSFL
ncbi:hypothetical protein ACFVYP_28950 [Kitasatospora sp. NPDC058201]|uniref:hypothetical protein n=1 Tax=unclassified Kitasatospora TaxID=2633591 RepID=UPI0036624B02